MSNIHYVSLIGNTNSNYVSLIASGQSGAETAGSLACTNNSYGNIAKVFGETAGSVASSSAGSACSSSSSGSFSAIA